MEHLVKGFVFPNEIHVTWSVMIVMYPYITGMVAGAFIVSSFYHVFGMQKLKPVARFSLVSSLAFLCFATAPLLNHLGRPERGFNIMITPNFTSAMSGFGFVYQGYLVIVVLEVWLAYREDFIRKWRETTGLAKTFWFVVLLGCPQGTERTRELDHRFLTWLAGLGIPVACVLHGYVGFLFGSIKANPWWSTPLMFIIFIYSAIVSGLAVIIWLYQFVHWLRRRPIDQPCLDLLAKWMWGFMIVAVTLELMELLSLAYEQTEEWSVLKELINGKLWYSYVVCQIGLFSVVPFLILTATSLFRFKRPVRNFLIWASAGLLLLQVLFMRWNVVIGGQLVSKSMRGFTDYFPGLFDKEGLAVAFLMILVPFLMLKAFDHFFPFFPDRRAEKQHQL
jgi:Ni/Fe-hydrogenase subunit HybB-like protein